MEDYFLPPIFENLGESELELVLEYCKEIEVDYGQTIIQEGEADPALVIVLDGQLEIRTGDTRLGRINRGEMIGEMALFARKGLRMASVETLTPATLLVLQKTAFETLRRKAHPVVPLIEFFALDALIVRLREIGDKIAGATKGTPAEHVVPSPSFFETVASMFSGPGMRETAKVDPLAVLNRSPLFQDADDAVLGILARHFVEETCRTGTFICTEGHLGDKMYLVASGNVDVICAVEGGRAEFLAVLEPGEAFGMGSLVQEGYPRMASCVARTACTVLSMDRAQWRALISQPNEVASVLRVAMIRALSEQLAYANAQLDQLNLANKEKTTREMQPLLRAGAGFEAHGEYMEESGMREYDTI